MTQTSNNAPLTIDLTTIVPAIRMMLSKNSLKTLKVDNQIISEEKLINFKENGTLKYIVINANSDAESILNEAKKEIIAFSEKNKILPKAILINNISLIAVGENAKQCDTIINEIKKQQSEIILDEQDNHSKYSKRAQNKTIVVTGAAQGFGEGIAECLLHEGANIVIADLNDAIGTQTAARFNKLATTNKAIFVKTNVSEMQSIENLIHETVCQFGAIDCFISNAGVLRAGGLEDMTPENFDFVTKINYNAYFYCTKVVSKIMKLQTKYADENYYADVIQINSKSGLRGSKANFAYAGGKFGGVGLTQSFALELAPFRIKVNSVCPGNFYDGPLWSDPENGLFVQYLKAGKVPNAKTFADVKDFYLAQAPMRKGCSPSDVSKGVLYLMEQCGETGQALPITGGQVMLS